MKVGVVKEIKSDEYRIALTPAGARELVQRGHEVLVEAGALFASSLDPETTLRTLVRIATPTLGDLCTVDAGAVCWRGGCVSLPHWLRDRPRYARDTILWGRKSGTMLVPGTWRAADLALV